MFAKSSWVRLHNTLSPAIVLLLLVWIAPVAAEPTSYNDPFRAIALQVPKPPDPPICCLKPLPPLEPVEDDLLLSFEEWKARQRHAPENTSSTSPPGNGGNKAGNGTGNGSEPVNAEDATSAAPAAQEDQPPHVPAKPQDVSLNNSPHFRVPLVDRFNYASLDCSAGVHKAHKAAKHPSNILSSKKDRYMLSPCKTQGQKQFVIIELCEDIRIDTVQLANFEFFSGVFKDFTVSVANLKTSSADEEEWVVAGTFRAKNVRGVQSFHPPTSLRDFYRYLRIDFHSHYGSEYYCPVSLLRVYGLTHLEEWKWELWEAESRAKMEAAMKDAQAYRATETVDHNSDNDTVLADDTRQTIQEGEAMPSMTALPINDTGKEVVPSSTTTESVIHSTDTYHSSPLAITRPPEFEHTEPSPAIISTPVVSSSVPISSTLHPSATPPSNVTPIPIAPQGDADGSTTSTTLTTVLSSGVISSSKTPAASSIVLTPTPLAASHPFLPMPISGGESIYRLIMNRLVGLERNHTLYEQYMAQQHLVVREALKRLGEDIGRLEGLGKAQRQAHDRIAHEWAKQRKQWQMEHAQLLQRIEYLSDEIIMEKRLGVAQLCLLLAVLIFMGLTRGSRGPVVEDRRYWRPVLKSLSGDWQRPRTREEDLRAPTREGGHVDFPKSAPAIMRVGTSDSGSGMSSASVDAVASAPPRYPLTSVELNTPPRQQQRKHSNNENQHPGHGQNVFILADNHGTPPRTRSQTTSRSRSRTSSWAGKGVSVYPNLSSSRLAVEARGSYPATVTNTPSKGSRVSGVYLTSNRPTLASVRNTGHTPHVQRRTLQRSHSSHGEPGSIDYILPQTWTGSGNGPKSARRWARTAHLHEVKGKRRVGESWYGGSNGEVVSSVNGAGDEGRGDVFGGAESTLVQVEASERERSVVILRSEDADVDADGWESASDVGVDSIEGI